MSRKSYSARYTAILFGVLMAFCSTAQTVNKEILEKTWKASWISIPGESLTQYGVYIFRKNSNLTSHVGTLTKASGEMPHPKGKVAVSYFNTKEKWNVVINLPETISGDFIWKGKYY